jgi:hypothetical protein
MNCMAKMTSSFQLLHAQRRCRLIPFPRVLLAMLILAGSFTLGCGSGDEGSVSAPMASKSLAWDPVKGAYGYLVYYGTESPGVPGSCGYAESVFTTTPSLTVTGLAAHTTYYFAVSAFNGLESPCSAELKAVIDSI